MSSLKTFCVFIFVLTLLVPVASFAGEAQKLVMKKELAIRDTIATPTEKGTEAHSKKEEFIRDAINALFDFEELGMRSLVFHWEDLTPEKQKDFVSTLKALIEKNYLLRITGATTYKLKWYDEYVKDGANTVRFKVKSGKYRAAIQFRMINKAGKWVVYDMLIDDVSLLESYRSQFNKFIRKDGFDKLMEKMKSKLDEMDVPADGKIADDRFDSASDKKKAASAEQEKPKGTTATP